MHLNPAHFPWYSHRGKSGSRPEAPARWTRETGPDGGDFTAIFCHSGSGRDLWTGTAAGDIAVRSMVSRSWSQFSAPFGYRSPIRCITASPGAIPRVTILNGEGDIITTDDRGKSWRKSSGPPRNVHTTVLYPHPLHPALLYAVTGNGLYCSPDGGREWLPHFPDAISGRITALCFHPANSLVIFAATGEDIPVILLSVDGGASFSTLPESPLFNEPIHSLIYLPGDDALMAGLSDSAFWIPVQTPNRWIELAAGLPATGIRCYAGDSLDNLWAGSAGAGLYRFRESLMSWRRVDTDPGRRTVNALHQSPDHLIAAFNGNGIAVLDGDHWEMHNSGLAARTVNAVAETSAGTFCLADRRLFQRNPDGGWRMITGIPQVSGILAHDDELLVFCRIQGTFIFDGTEWSRADACPGEVLMARADISGGIVCTLSATIGGIACFIMEKADRFDTDNRLFPGMPAVDRPFTWRQISNYIPEEPTITDMTIIPGSIPPRVILATSRGLLLLDPETGEWNTGFTDTDPPVEIVCAVQSGSPAILTGQGKSLRFSRDGGHTMEPDSLAVFPSSIRHITMTDAAFRVIWITTQKGGLYAGYLPDTWMSLVPEEPGIPILDIAFRNLRSITCATGGVSCVRVRIPALSIRCAPDPDHPARLRLFMALQNPCGGMEADLHLMLRDDDGHLHYLDTDDGAITRGTAPVPIPIVLHPETDLDESCIGIWDITGWEVGGFILLYGLFATGSWIPLTPLRSFRVELATSAESSSGRNQAERE